MKAAYDAKKAAKEGNKLRMTQRNALAKEGEPLINLLIYFSTPFNFFSQLRQPFRPPVELFIKAKAAFEAKKAAQEENKLIMKQRRALAKVGELPLQY